MTEETKKLFGAPWNVTTNMDIFEICKHGQGFSFAETLTEQDANRLARLPEIYDALLRYVCTRCNACIYDHCGSPVECEQLLSQVCMYEYSKLCFEHEARELLRKVRDGK